MSRPITAEVLLRPTNSPSRNGVRQVLLTWTDYQRSRCDGGELSTYLERSCLLALVNY